MNIPFYFKMRFLFGKKAWVALIIGMVGLFPGGDRLLGADNLLAPEGKEISKEKALGWTVSHVSEETPYQIEENVEQSRLAQTPFLKIKLGKPGGDLHLVRAVQVPEPGTYRLQFEFATDNGRQAPMAAVFYGFSANRSRVDEENGVKILGATDGVRVEGPANFKLTTHDFPPGAFHEIYVDINVPADVASIDVSLQIYADHEQAESSFSFGNVKLEKKD